MKKNYLIVFILMLALMLCACEGVTKIGGVEIPPLPDVESMASPAVETATPKPVVSAYNPLICAYYKHVAEESYDPAEGEKLILSFSYDAVSFLVEGRDSASSAINEYIARLDETYYTGNDYGVGSSMGKNRLLELAEDNYRYAFENGLLDSNLEYSSSRTAAIGRADAAVISLVYSDYVCSGEAQGSSALTAYVFDSESGALVTMDMLSKDADALKTLIIDNLKDAAPSVDAVNGSWYFNADGLIVIANDGDGSASEHTIPYSELKGIIDDKWLPIPADGSGTLKATALEEVEDGTVEIVDKITVDTGDSKEEGGRQICLIAEGVIYEVKLSTVQYSDKFYETGRIWYCNELKDCAFQVVAFLPEGMPNLMVSYRTADGTVVNRLISESGKDGSIVLVDDNIEAVG